MASSDQKCQLVMLVDLQAVRNNTSRENDKVIERCVLQLLSNINNKCQQLRWGYKFFNSGVTNLTRVEKHSFREFDKTSFEEFESELEVAVDRSTDALQSKKETGLECGNQLHLPNLHRALQEISYEFHWDVPDISSPVKQLSKRNRKSVHNQCIGPRSQQNFIYLISKCPKTKAELQQLSGRSLCMQKSDVLDVICPKSLCQQYQDNLRISLYWMDVDMSECCPDISGMQLVDEALKTLQGSVVSLRAILYCGTLWQSNLASLLKINDNSVDKAQIISAVTDQFLPSSCASSFHDGTTLKIDDRLDSLMYYERNGEQVAIAKIRIQPILLPKFEPVLPSRRQSKVFKEKYTLDYAESPLGTQESDMSLCVNEEQASQCRIQKESITILGTVGNVDLGHLQANSSYSVIPIENCASQSFEDMMMTLATRDLSLVAQYRSYSNGLPLLGILKPLTTAVATLTLVKSGAELFTEKLMTFDTSSKTIDCSVEEFISKSTSHLLKSIGVNSSDMKIHNMNALDDSHFKMDQLEGWFSPALQEQGDKWIRELSKKCDDSNEAKICQDLQGIYRKAKSSRITDTPTQKKKELRRSPRKRVKSEIISPADSQSGEGGPSSVSGRRKKSGEITLPVPRITSGRAAMIFQRKKAPNIKDLQKEDSKDTSSPSQSQTNTPVPIKSVQNFKDEADMKDQLMVLYGDSITDNSSIIGLPSLIVQSVHHHFTQQQAKEPSVISKQFIEENVLQSCETLRQKYLKEADDDNKLREYKMQVELRFECEVLGTQELSEDVLGERSQGIAEFLRGISFTKDATYLAAYLNDAILEKYRCSIPKLLGSVYDELLQPIPPSLEQLLDNEEDESGATASVAPISSIQTRSMSSNPGSLSLDSEQSKSKKFGRYSSFSLPKRQISVQVGPSQDKHDKRDKKVKSSSKNLLKEGSQGKGVKRNLFRKEGGLPRRQSVAVMESHITPKKQTPRRKASKTPRSHHILKTKAVTETPAHKQVNQSLWKRQERHRKRTQTMPEVAIVEESPEKPMRGLPLPKLTSPRRKCNTGGGIKKRKSFYSTAPEMKSRNVDKMEKYDLLEQRMTTSRRLFSPQKSTTIESEKSPQRRRITTTFLLSSLISSPTPIKPASAQSFRSKQETNFQSMLTMEPKAEVQLKMRRNIFNSPLKTWTKSPEKISSPVKSLSTPQKLSPAKAVSTGFETPKKGESPWRDMSSIMHTPNRASRSQAKLFSEAMEMAPTLDTQLMSPPSQIPSARKLQPRRINPSTCKNLSAVLQSPTKNPFTNATFGTPSKRSTTMGGSSDETTDSQGFSVSSRTMSSKENQQSCADISSEGKPVDNKPFGFRSNSSKENIGECSLNKPSKRKRRISLHQPTSPRKRQCLTGMHSSTQDYFSSTEIFLSSSDPPSQSSSQGFTHLLPREDFETSVPSPVISPRSMKVKTQTYTSPTVARRISPRKFSPNMPSAKSMAHLISSPLIDESSKPSFSRTGKSRRSLYDN